MTMNGRGYKPGYAGNKTEQQSDTSSQRDPRAVQWLAMIKEAVTYNHQHPDEVAEFNRLTGGKCAGQNAGLSVREVKRWQMDRGLPTDGKIGPRTLQAAKREAKAMQPDGGITFTETEVGTVDKQPEGDLVEQATADGVTSGQEHTERANAYEGDSLGAEIAEKGGEEVAGKVAGKVGGALVMVPELVALLRRHEYKAALSLVWHRVGQEDRIELIKVVAEKLSGELGEHALVFFEKAALAGAVVDVLALGWEWTKLGLESIYEAHEKGDQKARIHVYGFAWSDTVLRGEHSNPGAVTEGEREAMRLGIADGRATREMQPELPFLLMLQYHNERAAREALQLSLMMKAGIG